MGGAVRIPIYEQQIGTPTGPAPSQAEAVPQPQSAAPALLEFANKLGEIHNHQVENQRTLQLATVKNSVANDLANAKSEAEKLPALAPDGTSPRLEKYKDLTKGIAEQAVADPANAAIAPLVKVHVTGQIDEGYRDLLVENAKSAVQQQEAHMTVASHDASTRSALGYQAVTKPDGTVEFKDTPQAHQADADFIALLDSYHGPDAEAQKTTRLAAYNKDRTLQRGEAIAQDQPQHVDDFIKQEAAEGFPLSPQEHVELWNKAKETINRGMQNIDANNNAARAQAIQTFEQQALAGNLDTGALQSAAAHKIITPEDYQRLKGVPFAEPSDSGSVAAARGLIDDAHTPPELDAVHVAIASNPNIRGKESIALTGAVQLKKANINTDIEKAKAQAAKIIHASYEIGGFDKNFYNKFAPVPIEQLEKAANDDLRIDTIGATPSDIIAAAHKAAKAHPIDPSILNVGKPKGTPPPLTDDQKRKIAADLRSKGKLK